MKRQLQNSKESRGAERSRPPHQDHAGLHTDVFQHKIISGPAPPAELKEENNVSVRQKANSICLLCKTDRIKQTYLKTGRRQTLIKDTNSFYNENSYKKEISKYIVGYGLRLMSILHNVRLSDYKKRQ